MYLEIDLCALMAGENRCYGPTCGFHVTPWTLCQSSRISNWAYGARRSRRFKLFYTTFYVHTAWTPAMDRIVHRAPNFPSNYIHNRSSTRYNTKLDSYQYIIKAYLHLLLNSALDCDQTDWSRTSWITALTENWPFKLLLESRTSQSTTRGTSRGLCAGIVLQTGYRDLDVRFMIAFWERESRLITHYWLWHGDRFAANVLI